MGTLGPKYLIYGYLDPLRRDVFVAFEYRAHCSWKRLNVKKDLATRQKVSRERERLKSRDELELLFDVIG